MHKVLVIAVAALIICLPSPGHAVIKKGAKLPLFSATAVNGDKISSAVFSGKVLLLAVSSDICSYCKTAIPQLNRLNEQYGTKGLQIQGLIYGGGFGKEKLKRYLKDNNVTFPLALAEQKTIYDTIGAFSIPTYLLIDKKGNVAGYFRGFSESNMKLIEQQAKTLLLE